MTVPCPSWQLFHHFLSTSWVTEIVEKRLPQVAKNPDASLWVVSGLTCSPAPRGDSQNCSWLSKHTEGPQSEITLTGAFSLINHSSDVQGRVFGKINLCENPSGGTGSRFGLGLSNHVLHAYCVLGPTKDAGDTEVKRTSFCLQGALSLGGAYEASEAGQAH